MPKRYKREFLDTLLQDEDMFTKEKFEKYCLEDPDSFIYYIKKQGKVSLK